ncbi:glucose-6-phosphate dehydrogenase assembly protein OpcA [Tundrisphaera lichenicola]|uniref:glucose-6-phosphate dehydrogenase assembly protein OpcA n=1 Tax=Tundrisphaera lichenicola TaxID=2029860 RepID=UPI003EBC1913
MTDMGTTQIVPSEADDQHLPLGRVDAELDRRLEIAQSRSTIPLRRVRMSNLIIYCSHPDQGCQIEGLIPEIIAIHPARVLLLVVDSTAPRGDVTASVQVRQVDNDPRLVSEQVTLKAGVSDIDALPFAVRSLLIGDLPTNLWWACPTPPPVAGPILEGLAESAEQLIFDSLGWSEPTRGVAQTSSWLDRFERGPETGRWRIASDLAWRRLKSWRRLLSQGLDPATAPDVLSNITDILIEHGPHAVTQAWGLAGWLASRLNWTFQAGKIHEDVEIAFRFEAPHGPVKLRIDRLPEGTPEIARIRVTSGPSDRPTILDFVTEPDGRLSVVTIGGAEIPRTVSSSTPGIAALIARQLTDREPDKVFRESMQVAQQLARRVAG